ncbi:hypothetical protein Tcan_18313 [Toxocara canis]|uniref:Uncharacterized protein n=1 Tax=Toxocara canis TaxID=6265 RepID=A0A0B2VNB8_TOXCA|nr:hypothetical protein Tcan_18313 [Toxocara canis]
MRVSVVRSKLSALWTSPSLAAFLLINMLLICILLPVICVQIAHIALNERDQYQFKGYNLGVVFTFVIVDLCLYAMLKYIICCSEIFDGCSPKLRIPLCTGSQFVPVYIVFKNVDVFFSTRPSDPTYGSLSFVVLFYIVTKLFRH